MPENELSFFKIWWRSVSPTSVVSVRFPHSRHGNSGKTSNSAKTKVLDDFLTFVDTNKRLLLHLFLCHLNYWVFLLTLRRGRRWIPTRNVLISFLIETWRDKMTGWDQSCHRACVISSQITWTPVCVDGKTHSSHFLNWFAHKIVAPLSFSQEGKFKLVCTQIHSWEASLKSFAF